MEKTIHQSLNTVYSKSKEAIKILGWSLDYDNRDKGVLEASTGTSLLSWGEKIEIRFTQHNHNITRVTVKSNVHSQIIGWGKDSANEKEFITTLTNLILK